MIIQIICVFKYLKRMRQFKHKQIVIQTSFQSATSLPSRRFDRRISYFERGSNRWSHRQKTPLVLAPLLRCYGNLIRAQYCHAEEVNSFSEQNKLHWQDKYQDCKLKTRRNLPQM